MATQMNLNNIPVTPCLVLILPAATGGLVLSNAPIATLNPAPSPISTFSFGTTTSSNVIP